MPLTVPAAAIVQLIVLTAVKRGEVVTVSYRKPNGTISIRAIRPRSIERCDNGNTIVRATCVHAEAAGDQPYRSFTLNSIEDAVPGDHVTNAPVMLQV